MTCWRTDETELTNNEKSLKERIAPWGTLEVGNKILGEQPLTVTCGFLSTR